MLVRDILRIKGNTLFTSFPQTTLKDAVDIMVEHDIGSLVIMEKGSLVGLLTFREILKDVKEHNGELGNVTVGDIMQSEPFCTNLDMPLEELQREMVERYARYVPVMDDTMLMGVISFHDVARAVIQFQAFENRMLKGYIRAGLSDDEAQK